MAHKFEDIISLENLFLAWQEFLVGKKGKRDVQIFARDLADNILALHEDLANKTYRHGGYESFYVNDPKRRHIHKAAARDRLLHHAVYRILYQFFEKTFIADSFSCRLGKGTHKAINRFRAMAFRVSQNHTRTVWVLKCDIKKFFASIDHEVLLKILKEYIPDENILWLLKNVIESFATLPLTPARNASASVAGGPTLSPKGRGDENGVGLPLGNLTSQLFANVYMNVFDQWVKHKLKAKNYLRYADDFVFLSENREWLLNIVPQIKKFLAEELKLTLHPKKIILKTVVSGVDFLGWVCFSDHRVLRQTARRRMLARILENPTQETLQSYLGLLKHGNTLGVRWQTLINYWLWG
ncbi:group II intron reverse transcriptase domain-containing protein [Candidatus Falkowbacteria bacterium]|nr:group II intron reverse transcriptase domain-containing protein [Candidatus Falkowbacteria bacterium]